MLNWKIFEYDGLFENTSLYTLLTIVCRMQLSRVEHPKCKAKSFAGTFSKACRVKGRSPLWEFQRAKPSDIIGVEGFADDDEDVLTCRGGGDVEGGVVGVALVPEGVFLKVAFDAVYLAAGRVGEKGMDEILERCGCKGVVHKIQGLKAAVGK